MADKNYDRTTRICELESLRPDHGAALRDYAEKYDLGVLEPTLCSDTVSIKRKSDLLAQLLRGRPSVNPSTPTWLAKLIQWKDGWLERRARAQQSATYTSVVITPTMLMWVVSSNIQPATAFSAPLSEIEVTDYDPRRMLDRGLDVRAQPTNASKSGSYFIGLSEDEGGNRLKAGIMQAVKTAHDL